MKFIKRSIWLVLAILWMALIFSFSHQKAEASSEISGSLTYRITEKVNEVFDFNWDEERMTLYAEKLEHPVRKAAHMSEYAVFAWILLGNFIQYPLFAAHGMLSYKPYICAFLGAAFYAATDEFHQLFIEGRSGEIKDVCIDSFGAFLGLLLAYVVFYLWEKQKDKK